MHEIDILLRQNILVGKSSEKVENYDLLTSVMICLGDLSDKNTSGILKLLEVLLSSELDAAEKRKLYRMIFRLK